jgi:FMN-dependent NADH-azoreductase
MKLLHVDSSILGAHSISRQLSAEIVAKLRQVTPDLEAEPVPHLSGSTFAARQPAAGQPTADVEHDLVLSANVLDEFLAGDIVVVGAPMYNFGVPSQLLGSTGFSLRARPFAIRKRGSRGWRAASA